MGNDHKENLNPIISFSVALDGLICGGVRAGEVLEVLAEPNGGSCQLCHQLAVNATIPEEFGGRACNVLIADCNGNISPLSLEVIVMAVVSHLNHIASSKKQFQAVSGMTINDLLSKIEVVRCTNYSQLIALLNCVKSECSYGLLIIDSVATHFRHEFEDMRQRSSVLASISNIIHMMGVTHDLSVVYTNEVRSNCDGGLEPCLGESWSCTPHKRLYLTQNYSQNYSATVLKGKNRDKKASFKISQKGVRDL